MSRKRIVTYSLCQSLLQLVGMVVKSWGEGSIGKIMAKLMSDAGYDGFYSGHSLRRTGNTRLFQAGVKRKIVKECTGHRSDAIDKY